MISLQMSTSTINQMIGLKRIRSGTLSNSRRKQENDQSNKKLKKLRPQKKKELNEKRKKLNLHQRKVTNQKKKINRNSVIMLLMILKNIMSFISNPKLLILDELNKKIFLKTSNHRDRRYMNRCLVLKIYNFKTSFSQTIKSQKPTRTRLMI